MKITIVGESTASQQVTVKLKQGDDNNNDESKTQVTGEDTLRALKMEHQRLLRIESQNKPKKLSATELARLDALVKAEDAKRTQEERDLRFAAWYNRKERFFDRNGNEI